MIFQKQNLIHMPRAVLAAHAPAEAGKPFSLAGALEVDAGSRQKAMELLESGEYKKF